jgi:hypothetical protein
VDYWPWGVLALAAIIFGGVSIFSVPPLGLLGIAILAYYGWQAVNRDRGGPGDSGEGPR